MANPRRRGVEEGTDGTWGPRARRFALIPPALLVVVALTQMTCAKTSLLSPWKGGGFGMFSALDGISHRPLRVFAELADGQRRVVRVSPTRMRDQTPVRGFPSEAGLRRIARGLESSVLEAEPDAVAMVVEVWRLRFEAQTSSVRYARWRAVRWELAPSEELTIEADGAADER